MDAPERGGSTERGSSVDPPLLAAERAATASQVTALAADLADIVSSAELVATDDEHDPEGATIAFERARVGALLTQARDHLLAIDRAEARIAAGTYGTCTQCGEPIAAERLRARPTAQRCMRCAVHSASAR